MAPGTGKEEALEVCSDVQFPLPSARAVDQLNDGGFRDSVVEQVEPVSSSPLSEEDVVECMETDEEPPGVLESQEATLDVSTADEGLGVVHSPEGTLDASTRMGGPTAPDPMEVQATEVLKEQDLAVPKLMDIQLPTKLKERNQGKANWISAFDGEKDLIPPPKYRCYSRCPVPNCHRQIWQNLVHPAEFLGLSYFAYIMLLKEIF